MERTQDLSCSTTVSITHRISIPWSELTATPQEPLSITIQETIKQKIFNKTRNAKLKKIMWERTAKPVMGFKTKRAIMSASIRTSCSCSRMQVRKMT